MKRPKRRVVHITYGFRLNTRSKSTKKRVKKAQSPSQQPQRQSDKSPTEATEKQALTSQTCVVNASSPLVHFDFSCNPYQQFMDNLSIQLPDLPQGTFIRDASNHQTQDHYTANSQTKQSANTHTSVQDEQTDNNKSNEHSDSEETKGDDTDDEESATARMTNNEIPDQILSGQTDKNASPARTALLVSPCLHDLSNIPSCMLASNH
ncbi:hypothetical protein [Marinomonas posidonica]|uniref:hypothetical protein n=1 Tax=Marinomonas posidonica TaxID=936476 RepID=UPI0037354756